MTAAIFKLLGSALGIWEHKEKTKYIDKMLALQREYYEEINKEISDDAVVDNIERELIVLVNALESRIANDNSKNI